MSKHWKIFYELKKKLGFPVGKPSEKQQKGSRYRPCVDVITVVTHTDDLGRSKRDSHLLTLLHP